MHKVGDKTIEQISTLAQLNLSEAEKQQAKKDMEQMLGFMEQIQDVDTIGVEPMTHIFGAEYELREDNVTNADGTRETMANAPRQKNGMFQVPKTVV